MVFSTNGSKSSSGRQKQQGKKKNPLPYTKSTSKWITDLNGKSKTRNLSVKKKYGIQRFLPDTKSTKCKRKKLDRLDYIKVNNIKIHLKAQ